MKPAGWFLTSLTLGGWLSFTPATAGDTRIARTERTLQQDRRVLADRLDSANNPEHRDLSFLNAVGAAWPHAIDKAGAGYAASTGEQAATGFLIDRCHVLTNLHVVTGGDAGQSPPLGRTVAFAVGQTASERDRGALQGLRFLAAGRVSAQGDARVLDGRVEHPEDDWALIHLNTPIDAIEPLQIAAADVAELMVLHELWSAGYPSDHRGRRADGFKLKDLWVSRGEFVGTLEAPGGPLLQSTLQTTPGNSGGPVYVKSNGRLPVVVGMVQSSRGNGIDQPNVQLLFTPALIARISAARQRSPCSVDAPAPGAMP